MGKFFLCRFKTLLLALVKENTMEPRFNEPLKSIKRSPRYNEPLYNEVLDLTNLFITKSSI